MKIHYNQCDEQRVMKLWRDGLSVTTIAKRMGVSPTKVRATIRKHEEADHAEPCRD